MPSGYRAGAPVPLTVYLHSLTRHHWQYHGSVGLAQLGEERDNLVLTPLARGVDGWYQHEPEYDTFEAWADVARHFDVDMDRVTMAGYSMGGYGTYRLATLYPDLVAAAMTVAGPPGEGVWLPPLPPSGGADTLTNPWLPSACHVPFLNVVAAGDQLVPLAGTRVQSLGAPELGVAGLEQLGYRYRFVVYSPAEHSTLAGYGYDIPMAGEFLGAARVTHDPARVTFVYAPAADDATTTPGGGPSTSAATPPARATRRATPPTGRATGRCPSPSGAGRGATPPRSRPTTVSPSTSADWPPPGSTWSGPVSTRTRRWWWRSLPTPRRAPPRRPRRRRPGPDLRPRHPALHRGLQRLTFTACSRPAGTC